MTIPTRPAPAPPGTRSLSATASANASIEQLRLQLQQQQQQQQQTGAKQNISIKLPPPPKRPTNANGFVTHSAAQRNDNNNGTSSSSITRKFPPARYSPATDWDDAPFNTAFGTSSTTTNGNFKKVPPPRPPPPKVLVRKTTPAPAPPQTQPSILSNLFQRKKAAAANAQKNGASRIYGLSSGNPKPVVNSATSASSYASSTAHISSNWNDNWNAAATNYSAFSSTSTTTTHMIAPEPQLITFDSPPSSPTLTQKSNSDCVSVDSFSSDSNFSSPNNGSVSQPESGFEDDFGAAARSRPSTTTPLDPWETLDAFNSEAVYSNGVGTAPVRNLNTINTRIQATNDNLLCNGKSLLPPPPSVSMPTIIKPKISQKPKAPKPPALMAGRPSIFDCDLPTPPSPPMPLQTPPSLPSAGGPSNVSILDVITGKVDAIHLSGGGGAAYGEDLSSQQAYGIALYNFDGVEEGDLSFSENDKIYLLEKVSDEWYRGRTRAGCEGIFPGNYIEIKVPLKDMVTAAAAAPSAPQTKVRCLYNFPAEVEGDLALKENDMVTILHKINEDWLFGEMNGRQGQFPSNFLEYVPANLPMP